MAPIPWQLDSADATPTTSKMGKAITAMPPIQTAGDGPLAEWGGGVSFTAEIVSL
jgi:hypothetical protein